MENNLLWPNPVTPPGWGARPIFHDPDKLLKWLLYEHERLTEPLNRDQCQVEKSDNKLGPSNNPNAPVSLIVPTDPSTTAAAWGFADLVRRGFDWLDYNAIPNSPTRPEIPFLLEKPAVVYAGDVAKLNAAFSQLVSALRICSGSNDQTASRKESGSDVPLPLSEREQQVADLIRKKGPLLGKEICNATGIEQSTLTSQVVPNLKKHGLKNRRNVGYYFS